jgi:oxygen-independent coproporphyrinogen-3 oxidase
MVLQMKTGRIEADTFRRKFGLDILTEFADVFGRLAEQGYLTAHADRIELTRAGLLRVDTFLPEFFEPQHRTSRWT